MLKNEVLKFRSVNNIVIAPAKTGKDNNNKIAVTKTDHTNNGTRFQVIPRARILQIVTMKLMAPAILLIPAIWSEKIPKSTDGPECIVIPLRGGYTVQPVPTPVPI